MLPRTNKDLYSRWDGLSQEERRHIVGQVTERITVGKEDVEIELYGLPSSPRTSYSGPYFGGNNPFIGVGNRTGGYALIISFFFYH